MMVLYKKFFEWAFLHEDTIFPRILSILGTKLNLY
jgi:hypothetical protein